MADEVRITVGAFQLEVPVVGCQPRVEHFRNGDAPVTEDQRPWRLLAAMTGVTFDYARADRGAVPTWRNEMAEMTWFYWFTFMASPRPSA